MESAAEGGASGGCDIAKPDAGVQRSAGTAAQPSMRPQPGSCIRNSRKQQRQVSRRHTKPSAVRRFPEQFSAQWPPLKLLSFRIRPDGFVVMDLWRLNSVEAYRLRRGQTFASAASAPTTASAPALVGSKRWWPACIHERAAAYCLTLVPCPVRVRAKRESGAALRRLFRGCPRNCKRRVSCPHTTTGVTNAGKVRQDTTTREPGDLPTNVLIRPRAGCPGGSSRARAVRGTALAHFHDLLLPARLSPGGCRWRSHSAPAMSGHRSRRLRRPAAPRSMSSGAIAASRRSIRPRSRSR